MKQIAGIINLCILLLLNGCIENDIPYPRIKAEILAIEAEGQLESAKINNTNRTVSFSMNENVDMQKIKLLKLELTEDVIVSPNLDSTSVIDLSSPKQYTLSIYQDYVWTISAEQVVNRYFKVNNQVGAEYIDVNNKVAIAYVEEGTDLSHIEIQDLKLGPDGKIIPDYTKITDFTEKGGVTVVVIYRNIKEEWTLFVAVGETAEHSVDAWERVAWLKGSGRIDGENGFEYKESGSENWIKVEPSEKNNGIFSARLSGLKEGTTYVSRSFSDKDYSLEVTFTTGVSEQLPNNSFENWHRSGKPYLFYSEGEDNLKYWDTGNRGATVANREASVTTPSTNYVHDGQYSIQLRSDYVGIGGSLGKFAAGNLFSGEFVDLDGLSGAFLDFGRPFTKHPSKLKGWYKYEPAIINYVDSNLPELLVEEGAVAGELDKAHIWVVLTDAKKPIRIANKNRPEGLYDYTTDPNLIAYGQLIEDKPTSENSLIPFEIKLEYFHTDRLPTYIAIVCSASKYGDYFTGGTGSTLWLDDFELIYD